MAASGKRQDREQGERRGASDAARADKPLRGRERREAGQHSALGEKLIGGVPARIMKPLIVFLVCLVALLAFGLLMVYSASSVEALSEGLSSTYYLENQAKFMVIGIGIAAVAALVHMSFTRSPIMWVAWGVIVLLLLAVLLMGESSGGATRWIRLGGFQFQPSELAKPVIILTAAMILHQYYGERSIDMRSLRVRLAVVVLIPIALLFREPDFGTCIIIGGTVFVMWLFAGMSGRMMVVLLVAVAILGIAAVIMEPYRLARITAAADPWQDPYGTGYQATLAIMAFASGGLFGRGIGNSTMKYNYLPEAHNDYILAIIGEEVGFVGTLIFFAVVAAFVYSAYKIAEQSPTVQGKTIAYGCATMLGLQYIINITGIIGVAPMTGKPLPFISYGGSALIGALILVGLVVRVSIESNPRTVYDARREGMRVVSEGDVAAFDSAGAAPASRIEGSTAGAARPRSARRRAGFTVVDGTSVVSPSDMPQEREDRAARTRAGRERGGTRPARTGIERRGSYERVNLGSDPADRLRSRGVNTRYDGSDDTRRRRGGRSGRGDTHGR